MPSRGVRLSLRLSRSCILMKRVQTCRHEETRGLSATAELLVIILSNQTLVPSCHSLSSISWSHWINRHARVRLKSEIHRNLPKSVRNLPQSTKVNQSPNNRNLPKSSNILAFRFGCTLLFALRSASTDRLEVPYFKLSTIGGRAHMLAEPSVYSCCVFCVPTCLLLTHVALCQRVRSVITRTRYINVPTYLLTVIISSLL